MNAQDRDKEKKENKDKKKQNSTISKQYKHTQLNNQQPKSRYVTPWVSQTAEGRQVREKMRNIQKEERWRARF